MVSIDQSKIHSVLLIEDDEETAEFVSRLLHGAGYETSIVDRGEDALQRIAEIGPDIVLLDIRLPDISGIEILRQIRANSIMPIIVVSGFGKDNERVIALESGADDFIVKPFSSPELVARVKALLRRVEWGPKSKNVLSVRGLLIDIPRRQASINGRELRLTPIEYDILTTLMRSAGRVISHDELLDTVWGEQYVGDFSVLRVNISRLRYKIEKYPRHPVYIVTVPGQGYWIPVSNP